MTSDGVVKAEPGWTVSFSASDLTVRPVVAWWVVTGEAWPVLVNTKLPKRYVLRSPEGELYGADGKELTRQYGQWPLEAYFKRSA